ncbi:MAG: Fe-S cluster assembly protein HesB [Methanomicrobiales archaeon]|nr:Fe-S cluster assembly protein HesB [Methanomicrobiales archaeon]
MSDSSKIREILRVIEGRGDLGDWWPGQGDEVVIGAVLTQQTRWENVEMALARLKQRGLCDLGSLNRTTVEKIEDAIRPAGFYRVKTRRLRALSSLITEQFGTLEEMARYPLSSLRQELLSVPGIGGETADCILCFGLQKPTLVIDRYTERICTCAGIREKGESLKALLENALCPETPVLRQVHARFVEHAKIYCGKNRCEECGIARLNG